VRRAASDDADLLARWHAHPDISRFWDGKTYSPEQMLVRLARPDVHAYIVEVNGEPIGYLQAWFGEADDVGGLDMFLIPSARGQGLGPDAASTLARYLLDEGGRRRVTVDPYTWNEQAVRGWQKAGFRPIEEREPDDEHLHRWLLMEFSLTP
jgi:aminoglycoside 6'-N-acetyltransferase